MDGVGLGFPFAWKTFAAKVPCRILWKSVGVCFSKAMQTCPWTLEPAATQELASQRLGGNSS